MVRRLKWLALCALSASLGATGLTQPNNDTPRPLSKLELIDVFQHPVLREHPDAILERFVRRNKIAFLPTSQVREELRRAGVPDLVLEELKSNFATRIVYRVARFQPVEGPGKKFTEVLSLALGNVKFATRANPGHVLFGKTFNPVPTDPGGPTPEELRSDPNVGYVVIMGRVGDMGAERKTISAQLAFVSVDQQLMTIAPSWTREVPWTRNAIEQAAEEVAHWSIREVERQLR